MKIINFFKNDFRSVHWTLKDMTNGKMPTWVITIYYILVAPIGLVLLPFVKIGTKIAMSIIIRKLKMECEAE